MYREGGKGKEKNRKIWHEAVRWRKMKDERQREREKREIQNERGLDGENE